MNNLVLPSIVTETSDTFASGLHKYKGSEVIDWEQLLNDNSILNQFILYARQHLVPVGTIIAWPSTTLPDVETYGKYNWCDGGESSRSDDAELWQAIGVTFGSGDGETTFNRPDLRNRFVLGYQANLDMGNTGGSRNHDHSLDSTDAGIAMTMLNNGFSAKTKAVKTWSRNQIIPDIKSTSASSGGGISEGYAIVGNTAAVDMMPPYLTLAYIIKT